MTDGQPTHQAGFCRVQVGAELDSHLEQAVHSLVMDGEKYVSRVQTEQGPQPSTVHLFWLLRSKYSLHCMAYVINSMQSVETLLPDPTSET